MLARTAKKAASSLSQSYQTSIGAIAKRSFASAPIRSNQESSSSYAPAPTEASSSSSTSNRSSSSSINVSKAPRAKGKTIPASSPDLDKVMPLSFPSKTLREFPSLLQFSDLVLDPHPDSVYHSKPTSKIPYPSTTTFLNEPKHFEPTPPSPNSLILSSGSGSAEINSEQYLSTVTPLSSQEVRNLHQHAIVLKRVVHMTTKGKDSSMYALVVAGNGNGLVGYGEGKDTNAGKAGRKAFHEAVKNMDSVSIHKGMDGSRTIETEIKAKWGASLVVLRPRPAGFGLRVPPVIHALCRSVGITDLSAAIYGSTNPINVVKAALQVLWGGAAPLGLGDGQGGKMRRKDKGRGMRTRTDMERSRGRRIQKIQVDTRPQPAKRA